MAVLSRWGVAATGILALLAMTPHAAAEPRLDSAAQLRQGTPPTDGAATVEFPIPFRLTEPGKAYFKVSPKPGNPVFGNGTAGSSGWWTEIRLTGPSGTVYEGSTTGDPPTQFGRLEANVTYHLTLRVHGPAGAFRQPGDLMLEYVLAQQANTTGSGSGGTMDPSVGLHLVLSVLTPQDSVLETEGAGVPASALVLIGAAALVVIGAAWLVARRRKRPPEVM